MSGEADMTKGTATTPSGLTRRRRQPTRQSRASGFTGAHTGLPGCHHGGQPRRHSMLCFRSSLPWLLTGWTRESGRPSKPKDGMDFNVPAAGYLLRGLSLDRRARNMLGRGRPQAERRKRLAVAPQRLAVAPHNRLEQVHHNIPARAHSRERTPALLLRTLTGHKNHDHEILDLHVLARLQLHQGLLYTRWPLPRIASSSIAAWSSPLTLTQEKQVIPSA